MAVAGPFYFAWVNETETTFNSGHHRMDEYIFSAHRILIEGEKPKLELVIENPHVGLLSALRKQWCWFAWNNGTSIVPLFFGRVVGIPTNLQAEVITVTFIAWPSNYVKQLQTLAETLKVAPAYDPVFTDVAHRDDPMTLFESYSKVICVDPVTNAVTASDILAAEDGNVDFTEADHFYPSLTLSPGSVPKTAVHVDASVSWTQTASGFVDMGTTTMVSLTGDGMIADWPKPLSNIAPGLTVYTSSVIDRNGTDAVQNHTWSSTWQNREKQHNDGDALSLSISHTGPTAVGSLSAVVSYSYQPGFLDPFATDGDGNPSPTNIPMSYNATTAYVLSYDVAATMTLEYRAARPHTERIIFTLFADVQPTTLDPLVSDDTETITISGSDVGVPIIDLLNWTTISGTFVSVGTVIFPDNPTLPSERTAQRAIVAGTAGTVEPNFSEVVGDTTADGGVTWVSLGSASPTENATNWTGVSHVPAGTIILPERPLYTTFSSYTRSNTLSSPPQATTVSEGLILQADLTGIFYVCTLSGTLTLVNGATGGTAVFTSLGPSLPDGKTYFLATTGGVTGAQFVIPQFGTHTALNSTLTDGSVVWTNIGSGDIPVGGVPGNVTGSTYFGTSRGQRSIQHLILRARARLRYASRAVTTSFECSYAQGLALTLRKSVTLHDHRLPGGLLLGKITGTELIADGGSFTCKVTLGSSVGKNTVISAVAGTPGFVQATYVDIGYQLYIGNVALLSGSDVGYTPIVPVPDEDGIRFPLTKEMIVVSEQIIGSLAAQHSAATGLLGNMTGAFGSLGDGSSFVSDPTSAGNDAQQILGPATSTNLGGDQVWYDLVLKPLNGNGSFNHVYHVTCTHLSLPQMINLEDESTA